MEISVLLRGSKVMEQSWVNTFDCPLFRDCMMPYSTFLMMKSMHVFPWRAISLARKWSVIYELRRKSLFIACFAAESPFSCFSTSSIACWKSVSAQVPLARSTL